MTKCIEVELPESTAEDLRACCRKFGLDFHLFVQRAIETKLAGLADDGADWREPATVRSYSSAIGTGANFAVGIADTEEE